MKDKICNLDYTVIEARLLAYFGGRENLNEILAQCNYVAEPFSATEFAKQYLQTPYVSPTGRTLDKFGRAVDHSIELPRHHCKVTGELTPDDIDRHRQRITSSMGLPKHLLGEDKS